MDKTEIIVALIAAIPGVISVIALVVKSRKEFRVERRHYEVEAVDVANKSVAILLEPLNKRIDELENAGKSCKDAIRQFEAMIMQKDQRIAELEQTIAEKDKRIKEMQSEINELRARVSYLEQNGTGGANDTSTR